MTKLALIATILVLATVFVYIVNDIKSLSDSDKLEANWPSNNFLWCKLASSHLKDYVEGGQGCRMEVPFCKNLFYPCILELDCTGVYNICGKNVSCYCTPTPTPGLYQPSPATPSTVTPPEPTVIQKPVNVTISIDNDSNKAIIKDKGIAFKIPTNYYISRGDNLYIFRDEKQKRNLLG